MFFVTVIIQFLHKWLSNISEIFWNWYKLWWRYCLHILHIDVRRWCCSPSRNRTWFTNFNVFKCGDSTLQIVDRYTYVGLLLSELLDFEMTAKFVAQSARRALGLLISKCKLAGRLPFNVYTKLCDSVMYPVISYGACIWGCKSYSCINIVQNRGMRFFLGVGKYTPVAALEGEMGWEPSFIKKWTCIGRHFVRISRTPLNRIN